MLISKWEEGCASADRWNRRQCLLQQNHAQGFCHEEWSNHGTAILTRNQLANVQTQLPRGWRQVTERCIYNRAMAEDSHTIISNYVLKLVAMMMGWKGIKKPQRLQLQSKFYYFNIYSNENPELPDVTSIIVSTKVNKLVFLKIPETKMLWNRIGDVVQSNIFN